MLWVAGIWQNLKTLRLDVCIFILGFVFLLYLYGIAILRFFHKIGHYVIYVYWLQRSLWGLGYASVMDPNRKLGSLYFVETFYF